MTLSMVKFRKKTLKKFILWMGDVAVIVKQSHCSEIFIYLFYIEVTLFYFLFCYFL